MIKLNGVEIKPTIFPDGTSQVWKIDDISTDVQVIEWEYENDAEIFHICQLAELISYWDDGGGSTTSTFQRWEAFTRNNFSRN